MSEEKYQLPTGDVDLKDLVRRVSKITGFSFLFGPEFTGSAKLVINHKVTQQEAFDILISVLADNGYTTIEKGRVIKIVPRGEGTADPNLLFLKKEKLPPTDQLVTTFIDLTNIDATSAAQSLQSLLSEKGKIAKAPVGNRLVVVDNAANVEKIKSAVAAMDVAGPKYKIEVVPLKRAGAAQVSEIITALFMKVGNHRGDDLASKIKLIPDLRTNSIVIKAPDDQAKIVKKLMTRLDDPSHPSGISVEYLKNADASDLSKTLEELAQ